MSQTQAENFNAFTDAYEYLCNENQMIADYYVSKYWDDDLQEWDIELINESVVRDIQKDVMYCN